MAHKNYIITQLKCLFFLLFTIYETECYTKRHVIDVAEYESLLALYLRWFLCIILRKWQCSIRLLEKYSFLINRNIELQTLMLG